MFKKQKPYHIYAKGDKLQCWYINTYQSSGSRWLIESLKQLDLPSDFTFVNLSANAGFYEKDAYNYFLKEGFFPTFIIDDKEANLPDEKVLTNGNFIYWDKHYDIIETDLSKSGLSGDVVLDSKGALWYAARRKHYKKNTIQVLQNYASMLKNDNSVLLIDYDKFSFNLSAIFLDMYCLFSRMRKKKNVLVKFPCEHSTYKILEWRFGRKIGKYFHFLYIAEDDKKYPLQKYRNTAYITKSQLSAFISYLL